MPVSFLNKETLVEVFSYEFFDISKNTFFTEHLSASTYDFLCFFYQLFQSELLMLHHCNAVCFTLLKGHSICSGIFSLIFFSFLFCYIIILFVGNKQNTFILFKLNSLCDKTN